MSPDDLIAVARMLSIRTTAKNPTKQAVIRRSISTAYYAAFHAVLRAAADQFAGSQSDRRAAYLKVYRSLNHRDLKNLGKGIADNPRKWALDQGMATISPELIRVAKNISELYQERITADYDPNPTKFAWSDAEYAIERAQHVIAEFSKPITDEKACFLVALSFKERAN